MSCKLGPLCVTVRPFNRSADYTYTYGLAHMAAHPGWYTSSGLVHMATLPGWQDRVNDILQNTLIAVVGSTTTESFRERIKKKQARNRRAAEVPTPKAFSIAKNKPG